VIGVNARDLTTLEVDRSTFERIAPGLPVGGGQGRRVRRPRPARPHRLRRPPAPTPCLVGEGLVTAGDARQAVADLVTAGSHPAVPRTTR
jgi:indole-3-glycerol phosphate synthase